MKLTGGDAPTPGSSGGAINFIFFAAPTVDSGLVIKNSVITGNAAYVRGGGIYALGGGNLRIENSTISDNRTGIGEGGGIYFVAGYDNVLEVLSSTISGNHASSGAGIHADGDLASVNIQSSHITGNQSLGTGGGIDFRGKDLHIQSSEIRDNYAGSSGGGLNARAMNGSITIDQATMDNNRSTAGFSAGGGAFIKVDNSTVTILDTTVTDNKALVVCRCSVIRG